MMPPPIADKRGPYVTRTLEAFPHFNRPWTPPLTAALAPGLNAPTETGGRPERPDLPLTLQLRVLWANLATRWNGPGL
jgi:hypothetical protein